jgi:hypothetical protein
MLTLELPVLVSVTVWLLLPPAFTFPKFKLVGLAVSTIVAATPPPLSAIVVGELGVLLTRETLPVADPATVGAKLTLNVVLCPAANVNGGIRPLVLKPAPETLICEMLTLELPVLVSVAVWLLLPPTFTFPKFKLVGLAISTIVAATPLPLSAIVVGELGALLTSEMLPETLPAAAGAKAAVKLDPCPGLSVKGTIKLLVLKPLPETVACEIVKLAVPELLIVRLALLLLPIFTVPNESCCGLTETCGEACELGGEFTTPEHAPVQHIAAIARTRTAQLNRRLLV